MRLAARDRMSCLCVNVSCASIKPVVCCLGRVIAGGRLNADDRTGGYGGPVAVD